MKSAVFIVIPASITRPQQIMNHQNHQHFMGSTHHSIPSLPVQSTVANGPYTTNSSWTGNASGSACTPHPPGQDTVCLEIRADTLHMFDPERFKGAMNQPAPLPSNSSFTLKISALYNAFFASQVGSQCEPKDYNTFQHHMHMTYHLAIASYCSTIMQRPQQSASYGEVEQCLGLYPGVVHVWVDGANMQAMCLSNLYRGAHDIALRFGPNEGGNAAGTLIRSAPHWLLLPSANSSRWPTQAPDGGTHSDWTLGTQVATNHQQPSFGGMSVPQEELDIHVTYDVLTDERAFKSAIRLGRLGIPPDSQLERLYDRFFNSEHGKGFEPSLYIFRSKLMSKCKLAVNDIYARETGMNPLVIEWDIGDPKIEPFKKWLKDIRFGLVRVRVDEENMHAVFWPGQSGEGSRVSSHVGLP